MIPHSPWKFEMNTSSAAGYQRALEGWAKAGIMHPVIGYATEIIEIWFADGLTQGERHLDDGEFLEVHERWADNLVCGFARLGFLQLGFKLRQLAILQLGNLLQLAFALQAHDPKSVVKYKNIQVRRLD